MSLFPVGLLIALASFVVAMRHLNQGFSSYMDFVAMLVVFGGTLAVGTMLLPWSMGRELWKALSDLVVPRNSRAKEVLEDCMDTIRNRRAPPKTEAFYSQTLTDGVELLNLGFGKEKIEAILVERLSAYGRRQRKIANSIRNLAKYPPAFGLMGTVLGLVNVMRGVSSGLDGKQTALEMAIALVATMYGLLIANLLINPAGEMILKKTVDEESFGEIAVAAVLLMTEETSMLEAQEVLNSYAPPEHRINLVTVAGSNLDHQMGAA